LQRKVEDKVIEIVKSNGWARVPLSPYSYIIREAMAIRLLDRLPQQLNIFRAESQENANS